MTTDQAKAKHVGQLVDDKLAHISKLVFIDFNQIKAEVQTISSLTEHDKRIKTIDIF